MENEKIIFFRNFLLRTFLIGIAFAILMFVAFASFRQTWVTLLASIFGTDEKELGTIMLYFFTNVRIILLFLILSPAIALHWMARKSK